MNLGSIRNRSLKVEMIDLSALRPFSGNARRHSRAKLKQIAKSIQEFGFTNPILVSEDLEIIAGHGRAAAAKLVNMEKCQSYVCRTSPPYSGRPTCWLTISSR